MGSASLTCPFCDADIDFARLPVVATNISEGVRASYRRGPAVVAIDRARADSAERIMPRLPSGANILGWIDGWPFTRRSLIDANRMSNDGSLINTFRRLMQVNDAIDLGPAEDLPAYLCTSCDH